MKFSEIRIGAIFRTEYDDCIKISEYKYVSSDNGNDEIFSIDPDEEVELITKCNNCKYKRDNYCKKLNTDIQRRESNMDYEEIKQDPETFSCWLFEMKGN